MVQLRWYIQQQCIISMKLDYKGFDSTYRLTMLDHTCVLVTHTFHTDHNGHVTASHSGHTPNNAHSESHPTRISSHINITN